MEISAIHFESVGGGENLSVEIEIGTRPTTITRGWITRKHAAMLFAELAVELHAKVSDSPETPNFPAS